MAGLNVLWMCFVATQQEPMTRLWYLVFICLSGRLKLWEKIGKRGLNVRVFAVYIVVLWKHWFPPFISSLITIPTGKVAQKSLSNANMHALPACTQHAHAGSLPQPLYSIPPSTPYPHHANNLLLWPSPRETREWTVNLFINTSINIYQDPSLFQYHAKQPEETSQVCCDSSCFLQQSCLAS